MSHYSHTTVPFVKTTKSIMNLIQDTGYQCWIQVYSFLFWIIIHNCRPKEHHPVSMIKDVDFFNVTMPDDDDSYKSLHDSDSSTLVEDEESFLEKPKKSLFLPWKSKSKTVVVAQKKAPFLRRFSATITQEQSNLLKSLKKTKPRISFLRRKTLPDISKM